ncbi:MAG TPA: putative sulfate exporter family transporter [Opitutaceae bacterium]|nr:putative sulfate exporter family transporter [Opitutaceae bacterium]
MEKNVLVESTPGSSLRGWVVPLAAVACLWPRVPAVAALLGGAALGLAGLNTRPRLTARTAHLLLQISVVALGASLPLAQIARAGLDGLGVTLFSIVATLLLGRWLGRMMGVPDDTTLLVSGGTAICGGSAIAALAGALRPRTHDVTIALATVFLLNGVALIVFPPIGHALGLTQRQFGWWAALAIHDTSSVVGAGLAYGSAALALATTVKLARALWIAPLTLFFSVRRRGEAAPADAGTTAARRPHFPWFILGFVAVAAIVTTFPVLAPAAAVVGHGAERMMVVTLFFIGVGFTREALRVVGVRPLGLGLTLWLIVGSVSLLAIKLGLAG